MKEDKVRAALTGLGNKFQTEGAAEREALEPKLLSVGKR